MTEKVRVHAIISGRVQGVCYRMETMRAAERIGVSGWVKNCHDGTVEAVFEGQKEKLETILDWCRKGPDMAQVTDVDVRWEDYRDEIKGFSITR